MSTDKTDSSPNHADTGSSSRSSETNILESSSFSIHRVTCDDSKESPSLREGVADLFKLYFEELYDLGCDLGFQGFQSEWTDLPGKYNFQKLFVAIESAKEESSVDVTTASTTLQSSQVVGCIAIRPLTESCGEVKRMYIRKSHRRNGLGKELALAIMKHAWSEECHYEEIKLDSLERLGEAVRLYERLGFESIPPYCECP